MIRGVDRRRSRRFAEFLACIANLRLVLGNRTSANTWNSVSEAEGQLASSCDSRAQETARQPAATADAMPRSNKVTLPY